MTKRELLTEVWQLPYGGADKTVDVHLSWLRRKLGETAQEPRYLHSVRGVGVASRARPASTHPRQRAATGTDRAPAGAAARRGHDLAGAGRVPGPLALLIRTVAAERAVLAATADAQALTALVAVADPAALVVAVAQVDATSHGPVSVFTADGPVLGAPAPRTPLVELRRAGEQRVRDRRRRPRDRLRGARPGRAHRVIRTFVTDAALTAGVGRAWLLLAGLGGRCSCSSLLVADRLARSLVRATIDVAAVSHRLARGELDARADPDAPRRGRRGRPPR